MCSSREYPYSPHRRDWNFLGGGGLCKPTKIKEFIGISRGVGVLAKLPSVGEVWIFSGITQLVKMSRLLMYIESKNKLILFIKKCMND